MTTGPEAVVHEGRRVFRDGNGTLRTLAEVFGYFGLASLALLVVRDATLVEALVIGLVCAVSFAVLILAMSLGRVQITRSEVRVRSWRGTRVIPRAEIAEVVHIKDLQVMGTIKGYVALLDAQGAPLWRSTTNPWTARTQKALSQVGRRRSVVRSMRSQDAAQQWPGMLPWSLANPTKGLWAGMGGALLVFAVLLAILWWLITGPLA